MDLPLSEQRWDLLADAVARAAEASDATDLERIVVRLEGATGVMPFAGPDPDPLVTARRFARVYAAAVRSGIHLDDQVLAAVDRGIAQLAPSTAETDSASARSSYASGPGVGARRRRANRPAFRVG